MADSDLKESTVWTAVSAAQSFYGDRYRTLEGLVVYLSKFVGRAVSPADVAAHLEGLIARKHVLKVGECYLPLKRWR